MNEGIFEKIYALLAQVPRGRVVTYGELALMAGKPGGGRLVGWAMRQCPAGLPWQRVVNASGQLRTSERLPDGKLLQQVLLEEEGVIFQEAGCVDLDRYGWSGEHSG